jgi:hypothetical protein
MVTEDTRYARKFNPLSLGRQASAVGTVRNHAMPNFG